MKTFSFVAGALALGFLSGCTGSTNPADAHLFDNIRNLNSGEYDRQIAEKDRQAAEIVRNNNASRSRIASLESQRSQNSRTLGALQSDISSARRSAAAARNRVAGDPAKSQQLSQLESQISAVQSDVNSGADPSVARSELRRINSAINALGS